MRSLASGVTARRALELLVVIEQEKAKRITQRRFKAYYPDERPLRRELYAKHTAVFRFGRDHQIRAFMAANRVGKTEGAGGFELTCHLTGRYPKWWEGARFTEYCRAWAAGDTRLTTRDILQQKLLGNWGHFGTGMIPGEDIISWVAQPGIPEAVGTVHIRHYDIYKQLEGELKQDGTSRLVFKSFDQGREAFQGTEQEVILLDEESDEGIRGECLLRLMTTDGLLIETFTPLKGLTKVVLTSLPGGYEPGMTQSVTKDKALVMAGWDDVPHLTEKQKATMISETPPHLIDARSKGIPSIGSGAVYPLAESEFVVDDFPLSPEWPRAYAFDVGWNRTACLWGALDPATRIVYLYAEYYRGQAEPPIHAHAVRTKGEWMEGVIDPASVGAGQADGKQLAVQYKKLGLKLHFADNDVEGGIAAVWQGLSTGGIKVFKSLQHWRSEYRMYRRDEKGKIVKENDHLMDDTRYLILSGMRYAKLPVSRIPVMEPYVPLDSAMGM